MGKYFCNSFSLWNLRGQAPRLQSSQSWEQVILWVRRPTCQILANFPSNKNTKEKQFVFPAYIFVKWINSSLSPHLSSLLAASVPQPRHLLGGTSIMLAHPGKAQQVCTVTICSLHPILSSGGCQEISEEEGAITLLCCVKYLNGSLPREWSFSF